MALGEIFVIPDDWEYRGEGNCHVVLGLPKLKAVLRIRKKDRPNNIFGWFLHLIEEYIPWWFTREVEAENRDLNFHMNVMRPLLGHSFVSEGKHVKLSRNQVKQIEYQLNKFRPDFRKHKILHFGRATLFFDFTTLKIENNCSNLSQDTFSIEIKPKKGWIPLNERNFPGCLFCLNQYMKLETKKILCRSQYCPKDLFSGDEDRMRKSILSLLNEPQNNIRIFQNGQIIYDEYSNRLKLEEILENIFECDDSENISSTAMLNDFVFILFQCLTRAIERSEMSVGKCCQQEQMFDSGSLTRGCVLEKILSIQMLDVEGTEYYNKSTDTKHNSEWDYVSKILNKLDTRLCVKCLVSSMTTSKSGGLIFIPYLLAAVANDCSLMITLKKILDEDLGTIGSYNIVKSNFGYFVFNIGVFDLYPKPLSTVKKHELRNEKLLKIYKRLKNEEVCAD